MVLRWDTPIGTFGCRKIMAENDSNNKTHNPRVKQGKLGFFFFLAAVLLLVLFIFNSKIQTLVAKWPIQSLLLELAKARLML